MLAPFPSTGRIDVSSSLACDLLKGAESLPVYDNKEFYSSALQTLVRDHIRQNCPDGFDWLAGEIRERIAQWPYCVLLQGLRFDEGNRLFIAINRAFGELVARPYEKPRAQLVHYIQPATDIRSSRGGQESERLHTDTADWETPVELISMVCVRADRGGGGRSRILDVDSVRDEVGTRLGMETLELLETEAVPWRLADYFGGGTKWRTVLSESSMCWRRYTIELALDSDGIEVSAALLASLDAFENVISASKRTVDFLMREGELLFADNWRTIHARTPIADGEASGRLMIRSWIRTQMNGDANAIRSNSGSRRN
ncbi:MAG TPA: TauD/TfdA family dioxygenase [Blastocatellia bacterium]|jgi:hypothetical protein|nr:TauD/TfdA family dioxygenase [Blastocatellia bacterium]